MNNPKALVSPRTSSRQRRASTSRRQGSLRRLHSAPSLEVEDDGGISKSTMTRRASLQRISAEEEKNSSSVVLSAELVYAEPVKVILAKEMLKSPKKNTTTKRRKQPKHRPTEEEKEEKTSPSSPISATALSQGISTTSVIPSIPLTDDPSRPKYPRSLLGMGVRIVKILHALLNIIVIRGSVLTRRNLNTKLDDYLATTQDLETADIEALYQEHIAHHLFVFYLSWGRLLVCLTVLMWGTCTSRLPRPIAIYIGMAMHWVDSIRALDSNHWLPNSSTEDESYIPDPQRHLTAEEEVQTAMAWLHLLWFLVDGFYCRQILQKRKQEEQRIQHELYMELIGEDETAGGDVRSKKKRN